MSSPCRKLVLLAAVLALAGGAQAEERLLRVCADPDNLPYSNEAGAGFENKIAELIAQDLHAKLAYDWWPQRRGFVRRTLGAGMCDVLIGVPADFERVSTTRPYYRSSYVFVTRAGEAVPGFADPAIRQRRIGVQLIGNDMAATPAGHALARAGATANVTGFTIFGDGPAAQLMVDALDAGAIDAALVWGPQAGYFAARAHQPLAISIARAPAGTPEPFEFSVALGVKRGNQALLAELDGVLERRRRDIDAILAAYHVPRTDAAAGEGR
ncbi:substrate-binding domain-containing protein [Massilia sp. Mn16-1_5]|uniref:substrate-binding domain-containing protein n=1 Tax=Massilia sp. Mn16-1_5 TaxID=2079199 RepID=UPI00109EC4C7|nr:substrate-binding domain-containing protein [Massilia sp. Mn16-1_5]THC43278.1 quinoprotein dehydrogenase-associated putative ABC transporter substrate-binding protein [Massilia sp. Mn16-1_5]